MIVVNCVHSIKKDGAAHCGTKNDRVFEFEILVILHVDVMCSKNHQKNHITMMITHFGQMVNDKRLPIATTPIKKLFMIV
jgi:hypothetical protein